MAEVKIHTGTRIKLKHVEQACVPEDFLSRLRDFAHNDDRVQAIFFFSLQAGAEAEQPSLSVALKTGFFKKRTDDDFLDLVDEIQLVLPDDLSINLYRFGASDLLARYCVESLEPIYLRSETWLEKQRKKYL